MRLPQLLQGLITAQGNVRPLLDGLGHHVAHSIALLLADQRPHRRLRVGARPHHELTHLLHQPSLELLGQGLVNDEAVSGHTNLTRATHLRRNSLLHSLVHIRVLQHNERRVTAELQRRADRLLRRGGGQRLADLRGTCERQLAQTVVVQQGGHAARRGRRQHLEHTIRNAGDAPQLREVKHRQRGQLRRLSNHGAARRQRRSQLAGHHRQREVPWGDRQHRPHRTVRSHDAPVTSRSHAILASDRRRPLAEPAQILGGVGHLALGIRQRAPQLQGLQSRQLIRVLVHQVEQPTQKLGTLPRSGFGPVRLNLHGLIHGLPRIILCRRGDIREGLPRGGVNNRNSFTGRPGAPGPT